MNLFNLIGRLVLDSSEYEKGIDSAKEKNEEFSQSAEKSAAKSAIAWAAVVAAIVKVAQSIKKMIVNSTEYADNIKNMAQIYGYSVKEIQEMQSVAEQSGKSIERVLRGIKSSGQTAAEYLGLTEEEYAKMVDDAYKFGTILEEDTLNKVDALGDRVAYLKAQWTAVTTALLAGEEGAEEAMDNFFNNVAQLIEQYAPMISKFVIKLVITVAKSLISVLPEIVGDVIDSIIDTILETNWIEVGIKVAKSILQGIVKGLGKFIIKLFGGDSSSFAGSDIMYDGGDLYQGDYERTETSNQKIDVNIKYDGDTEISRGNAELVGSALADRIDEILGRRLNNG